MEICRQVQEQVLQAIVAGRLWAPGEGVVVAVSGGPDSLCLLHVLKALQPQHGAWLHVAHLDHGFRGAASAAEARAVADLARRLGLPATVEQADVAALMQREGLGAEEAGRRVRYRFLAGVAARLGAAAIALGHTSDDQVETVLMHLVRGSGLAGLRGMRPWAAPAPWMVEGLVLPAGLRLVRPLLEVRRAETEAYCAAVGLRPARDGWNQDARFLRVRLRQEVLPLLEEINPRFRQAVLRLARLAAWQEEDLQTMLEACWPDLAQAEAGVVRLELGRFAALPRTLRLLALRRAVEQVRGELADMGWEAAVAAAELHGAPVGSEVALVQELVARREYAALAVGRRSDLDAAIAWPDLGGRCLALHVPGCTDLPGGHALVAELVPAEGADWAGAGSLQACLDAARVGRRLWLRPRRPGDRFRPLGMEGQKKLQDFFVDEKVPRAERDRLPLVVSPRGIVWVVGRRIDERFRVGPQTRQVLHLRWLLRPREEDCGRFARPGGP